jgi:hypothetical protein
MSGIAWSPIHHIDNHLVVLDAERRLYAGLARDGGYWHVVQPVRIDDRRVEDGLRIAGQLSCTCGGGVFAAPATASPKRRPSRPAARAGFAPTTPRRPGSASTTRPVPEKTVEAARG